MKRRERLAQRLHYLHFDRAFWVLFAVMVLAAGGALAGVVSGTSVLAVIVLAVGVYKIGEMLKVHELEKRLASVNWRVNELLVQVDSAHKSTEHRLLAHGERLAATEVVLTNKVRALKGRVTTTHKRAEAAELTALGARQAVDTKHAELDKLLETTYRDLARKIIEVENRLNLAARALKSIG